MGYTKEILSQRGEFDEQKDNDNQQSFIEETLKEVATWKEMQERGDRTAEDYRG